MDSISDSDSEDAGSIPAGATTEHSKEIKPLNLNRWRFFFLRATQDFHQDQFIGERLGE
jgi:hypothetical protein